MRVLTIDTELLVLLIVGLASRRYISKHKRLKTYTELDFDLLQDVLLKFERIILMPNVLAETSNFLGYIDEPIRSEVFAAFRKFILAEQERYFKSATAVEQNEFLRLGLTDACLLLAAADDHVILTADLDLYLAACSKGHKAVNFTHLREAGGVFA
jgi:hypothetical protein